MTMLMTAPTVQRDRREPEWLTAQEAADLLGYSINWFYHVLKRDGIPHLQTRTRASIRIHRATIERMAAVHTKGTHRDRKS